MAAQPVSVCLWIFPMKRVLNEVTEHIQKILQTKKKRLLKNLYLTVVHVDSMDSLLLEKYLKKKRKLSPDTQGSLKSPRTAKKGKLFLGLSLERERVGRERRNK